MTVITREHFEIMGQFVTEFGDIAVERKKQLVHLVATVLPLVVMSAAGGALHATRQLVCPSSSANTAWTPSRRPNFISRTRKPLIWQRNFTRHCFAPSFVVVSVQDQWMPQEPQVWV